MVLPARAQSTKIRIGLMLPYTGTFAQLGIACDNGFRMALEEKGNKLGGKDIEYFKVDDESEPSKGVENANKLPMCAVGRPSAMAAARPSSGANT